MPFVPLPDPLGLGERQSVVAIPPGKPVCNQPANDVTDSDRGEVLTFAVYQAAGIPPRAPLTPNFFLLQISMRSVEKKEMIMVSLT